MELTTMAAFADKAKGLVHPKRLVVPACADEHTLEAVILAEKEGVIVPIYIGNKKSTLEILEKLGGNKGNQIVDEQDSDKAAALAVSMVREGAAEFLMKGKMNTANFLRPVLNKTHGLNTGRVLSHITMLEIPSYHKLLAITDAAMSVQPSFEQKIGIVQNAVEMMRSLGYEMPKVAILCAAEEVNAKQPETVEAEKLQKMAEEGAFGACKICGPISFDIAMDKEAAKYKGFLNPVAGDCDIIVVPNLVAGNALVKALRQFAKADTAAAVMGAAAPIVLMSRATAAQNKFRAISLCAAIS